MNDPRAAQDHWSEEQVRARFDDALDGELSSRERAAFDEALARAPALRAAFERHRAAVDGARELARVSQVDLLAQVQHKLRARSAGRFYRDRFATQRSRASLSWMLASSACLVILVLLWFAYERGLLTP